MNRHDILQTVSPLRMVFWGALLCIVDIHYSQTTNGQGFRFDLLNDAVGMLLIMIAVFRLGAIPVHTRFANAMTFVKIVSVLAFVDALRGHLIMPLPPFVSILENLFGIVTLAAIVAFCVSMRWLCESAGLVDSARSWNITTWLFVVIYVIPLGLLNVASVIVLLRSSTLNLNLGCGALLLILVYIVPVIHLFISTSRMIKSAEQLDGEDSIKWIEPGN